MFAANLPSARILCCLLLVLKALVDGAPPSIYSFSAGSNRDMAQSPSYTTTHPNPDTTTLEIKSPSCFGKAAALLGSFCVPPTTAEQDEDPDHKLPRVTFKVERNVNSSPMTLFLFDDEKNSWPAFWDLTMRNRSCEEMTATAKVVVSEREDNTIDSYMNIMGKFPHNWYVVVVDCQRGLCPELVAANLSFFHPNSDGSADACTGLPQPAIALKEALVESWHALSVDNILHVAGLSPFGVAVLYMEFALMLVFSLVLLLWGARADASRRFLFWNIFFVTSMSGLCYLAMATGNGILVLRRMEGKQVWRLSDDLIANPGTPDHPNPFFDSNYAAAKTYPVFVARHALQLFTCPLVLLSLFLVSGVGGSTRALMAFCGLVTCACWLAGALIATPSRWAFWVFGLLFSAGVFGPMVGVLPSAAARRGRPVRRLLGRLVCIQAMAWVAYPWVWVLVDGAHALPSDLAVVVYAGLDLLSQVVYGVVLLSQAPLPAGWSDWSDAQATEQERLNSPDEGAGAGAAGSGAGGRGKGYAGGAVGGGVGLGNGDEL